MLTTPKIICVRPSSTSVTGLAFEPSDESAKPTSTDTRITLRMLPPANAPTTEVGIMLQEEIGHGLRLRLTGVAGHGGGIARRRRRVEPGARLHERAHHEADDQRDAGEDFKVEERLAADAADLLDTIHAGNAGRDGAEDHERDHHRDQPDEPVTERSHRHGGVWRHISRAQSRWRLPGAPVPTGSCKTASERRRQQRARAV